jgi:putative protease
MTHPQKPEIMSPAGHWPQLRAAIEAGADAVYFGLLKTFTARAKTGFSIEELPEALETLHRRGVRGYITFNTLVFDKELDEAATALAAIARAGADAIIVQDLGIVKLAKQIVPSLELHGSTQMTVTSAEGAEMIRELGVTRVVMARELSFEDIRAIRGATTCELEMFVHGALCVSYSGQCLSSEAWGGRSANRGQCAQACRLPYEMIVDGVLKPLGDARYLLSPEDLYALHQVPEIIHLGVSALKIEGRYKDADYVALATRAYRKAVDEAWAGLPQSVSAVEEIQLRQVYSRGFAPAFITGTNHQAVVKGRAPRHRGVLMGTVVKLDYASVTVEPSAANMIAPLKPGDGVVFDAAAWRSPQEPEEGGRVYQAASHHGNLELQFANGALNFARIHVGDLVWRSDDPALAKVSRPYTEASTPVYKQPLNVVVTAAENETLVAEWTLVRHPEIHVTVRSAAPLPVAGKRPIDMPLARDHFSRLGNTAYELAEVKLEVTGRPFAQTSVLNEMRREAVERLGNLQAERQRVEVRPMAKYSAVVGIGRGEPKLHVLVRTPDQLDAALDLGASSVTLDYLDLDGLRPSIERAQSRGVVPRIATPRILKPHEDSIIAALLKFECPLLVRSSGILHMLQGKPHPELVGDASLNATNAVTAQLLLGMGLSRLTPAHDLNGDQVVDLARRVGSGRFEAVVYHHLPVFHTEHCVFCRFLSAGTSYKDCGRPCDDHRVELRDSNGRLHPVLADVGCRNTVFGAEGQEASKHLEKWLAAGLRHFRLEFVHESAEQVMQIGRAFGRALGGHQTMHELNAELRRLSPQGTTEGSLVVLQ